MKEVIKEATTIDEAIQSGLEEMQLTNEDVDIEIVREEGLFKTACVKLTVKQDPKELRAIEFVQKLIELMALDTKAELLTGRENITVNLSGRDNGIAIGHRGEALDSIQYLTCLYANKEGGDYKKIVLDAENYRNKRVVALENLAARLADKAIENNSIIEVEPMNSYERKIIHSSLTEDVRVRTESEGVAPNRYVLIIPEAGAVAEAETSAPKASINFSKKGLGKVRRFGNNRT